MLRKYEAITDLWAAEFAEELIDAYPDAKLILNVHDIDEWYTSMQENITDD